MVRFELSDRSPDERAIWLIIRPTDAEVCTKPPRFEENRVVETTALTLARWHTRRLEWGAALRSGAVCVTGPRALAKALPTWNLRAVPPSRHAEGLAVSML